MAFYRKFKKSTKKMSTAAKKRYGIGKGRGGFKFTQVAKDLEMLKSRLNVEKKYLDQDVVKEVTIGQSNDEFAGYHHQDITPIMSQGTGESARIGNSIKATGMVIRMGLRQQSSTGKRIAKVCVVRSLSEDTNPANDLWDANPLTNFVDFHSPRNYTGSRGKDSTHKIIATKYVKLEDTGSAYDGVANMKLAIKLNDIVRYTADTSTTPEDFRYHLFVFLDYGNCNTLNTTSNDGCLIGGTATGALLQHQVRLWYVDN